MDGLGRRGVSAHPEAIRSGIVGDPGDPDDSVEGGVEGEDPVDSAPLHHRHVDAGM